MSEAAGNHTAAEGDVLALGRGADCACWKRQDGGISATGACGCPLHGMKALRAEIERLREALKDCEEAISRARCDFATDESFVEQSLYDAQMRAREALSSSGDGGGDGT